MENEKDFTPILTTIKNTLKDPSFVEWTKEMSEVEKAWNLYITIKFLDDINKDVADFLVLNKVV